MERPLLHVMFNYSPMRSSNRKHSKKLDWVVTGVECELSDNKCVESFYSKIIVFISDWFMVLIWPKYNRNHVCHVHQSQWPMTCLPPSHHFVSAANCQYSTKLCCTITFPQRNFLMFYYLQRSTFTPSSTAASMLVIFTLLRNSRRCLCCTWFAQRESLTSSRGFRLSVSPMQGTTYNTHTALLSL